MNTMTVRDFRTNLSANFDRVDAGERILVRRRNRVYTIVPVEDDDLTITPELQAKIDKARQEAKPKRYTYHQPNDEYREDEWDFDGAMENLNLMFSIGLMIANQDEMPKWAKDADFQRQPDKK